MNKKRKIALMVLLLIVSVVMVIIYGTEKEKLPIGSQLPEIKYWSKCSGGVINPNGKTLTIMFFKPDCPHCEYEFKTMNERLTELSDANIYFLTRDKKFIEQNRFIKWGNLSDAGNFVFASIDANDFDEKIGINITPIFLIYDKNGMLIEKILGETKFGRLLQSIKNAGGAQHQ